MAQAPIATARLDVAANCCNGRVGRRLIDLAIENEAVARLVRPTGVELIREAGEAFAARDTVNCCNGRVGRDLNVQEVVDSFNAE